MSGQRSRNRAGDRGGESTPRRPSRQQPHTTAIRRALLCLLLVSTAAITVDGWAGPARSAGDDAWHTGRLPIFGPLAYRSAQPEFAHRGGSFEAAPPAASELSAGSAGLVASRTSPMTRIGRELIRAAHHLGLNLVRAWIRQCAGGRGAR